MRIGLRVVLKGCHGAAWRCFWLTLGDKTKWVLQMAQRTRDLLKLLKEAGFTGIPGAGEGSHRELVHPKYLGAVTRSGKPGDDAQQYQEYYGYQEKQVAQAIDVMRK